MILANIMRFLIAESKPFENLCERAKLEKQATKKRLRIHIHPSGVRWGAGPARNPVWPPEAWLVLGFSLGVRLVQGTFFKAQGVCAGNVGVRASSILILLPKPVRSAKGPRRTPAPEAWLGYSAT